MKKIILLVFSIVCLVSIMGCVTNTSNGSMMAAGTYSEEEAGHHWVRPQEVTYELGDIIEYSVTLNEKKYAITEAVAFGYPPVGEKANKYVSYAATKLISENRIDGIFITSYRIEQDKIEKAVTVYLQGRSLTMNNLGIVAPERADQERFSVVIEEDAETGETKSYTIPVDMSADILSVTSTESGGLSKGAWITIDAVTFALTGAAGGLLIANYELGAGIPLAVVSFSALTKLVIDIIR